VRPPTDANPLVGDGDPGGSPAAPVLRPLDGLPAWSDVLAVVAHPDDESFGLGALLSSFVAAGSRVSLLCLTRGEASTLHGVEGDLGTIRARELSDAAAALGISRVRLAAFPDGGLAGVDLDVLAAEIADFAGDTRMDGIIAFDLDGVTGHPDHCRATEAAMAFASRVGLPVLGWVLPHDVAATLNAEFGADFSGFGRTSIDLRVAVDRAPQRAAIDLHRSQALPGQALWHRLELSGAEECARWQDPAPAPRSSGQIPTTKSGPVDTTATTNAATLSTR